MGPLSEKEIQRLSNLSLDKNFDNSVQSFRGHKVGKTLMRCHFSPLGPTDRRYIYTASYCGKVFLYDILQSTTKELDLQEQNNLYTAGILNDMENSVVRDAAWHPHKMELVTTNLKGQLFKWFNNDLYHEEIEDLEKQNEEKDETDSLSLGRRQSEFENYSYDYNEYDEDEDSEFTNQQRIQDEDDDEDEDEDESHEQEESSKVRYQKTDGESNSDIDEEERKMEESNTEREEESQQISEQVDELIDLDKHDQGCQRHQDKEDKDEIRSTKKSS